MYQAVHQDILPPSIVQMGVTVTSVSTTYGTKSAQDILQIEMQKMLSGIPHQVNTADDILIGGTVEEHDEALKQVLSILKSKGITLTLNNVLRC